MTTAHAQSHQSSPVHSTILITRVRSGWRAPDDLLPLLLPDPRAATITTHADWLWVRILDVVRALERGLAASTREVTRLQHAAAIAAGRVRLLLAQQRR